MKVFFSWIFTKVCLLISQTKIHYWWLPSWVEGFTYSSDEDDLDYNDDYETNPFDSYGGTDNMLPPIKEDASEQNFRTFNTPPEVVHSLNSNSPPSTKYYTSNGSSPRPCDKRVYLYNLQPDRLNTSGIFNPLKGKLTNCHSSGCER